MSFYGNITNTSKTQFQFDYIYSNRASMEANSQEDGIYIGRYILIEYDTDYNLEDFLRVYNINDQFYIDSAGEVKVTIENVKNESIVWTAEEDNSSVRFYKVSISNDEISFKEIASTNENSSNYTINYNIDIAKYGAGRGYDSTVWQKTYISGIEKYIMIAELNSVVPTFDLSADAPTASPLVPHFDSKSTDVYYKLHWQPSWGFRIAESAKEDRKTNSTNTVYYPSDEVVSYEKSNYNTDTDEIKTDTISYDGAIYFNKAGFDSENHVYAQDNVKDEIALSPTGISGNKYNKHDGSIETIEAPDIQELRIILPSLGNALCSIWDRVYGVNSNTNKRYKDISWKDANDVSSQEEMTRDPETIAGCINITHDLLGMIITDNDLSIIPTEEEYNKKLIYKKDNKYYRIYKKVKYSIVAVNLPNRNDYETLQEYNTAYVEAVKTAANNSGYLGKDWFAYKDGEAHFYNLNQTSGLGNDYDLAYPNGYEYSFIEIEDFAGKLGTVNGLILQLKNLMEIEDVETRDRSTVQGAINSLNDLIDNFDTLTGSVGFDSILINNNENINSANSKGVLKLNGDDWIKLSLSNQSQEILLSHESPNGTLKSTKSYENEAYAPSFGNNFQIPVIKYDEKGHIAEATTNTIKIPSIVISNGEEILNNADVITDFSFDQSSGVLSKAKASVGSLLLTGYETLGEMPNNILSGSDNILEGFQKIQNQIDETNLTAKEQYEELTQQQAENMNQILSELEEKKRFVEKITILASKWDNLEQSISTVNKLLESDTPHIVLADVSLETQEEWSKISYADTFNDNGNIKIKFVCLEESPTVDLTLQIEVIRL